MTIPNPAYTTILSTDPNYSGPEFDGDSGPFRYLTNIVQPFWVDQEQTVSGFHWYEPNLHVVRPNWREESEQNLTMGVDRVMFFPKNGDGVPWSGVSEITESNDGGSPEPYYLDGIKYANHIAMDDFAATIVAYSSPRAFHSANGFMEASPGLYLGNQVREGFALSYRTGFHDTSDYELHLVYGAKASPSEVSHKTISNTNEAATKSWSISTLPFYFGQGRPTAHVKIDSRVAPTHALFTLEDMLYGTDAQSPTIPTIAELVSIFS